MLSYMFAFYLITTSVVHSHLNKSKWNAFPKVVECLLKYILLKLYLIKEEQETIGITVAGTLVEANTPESMIVMDSEAVPEKLTMPDNVSATVSSQIHMNGQRNIVHRKKPNKRKMNAADVELLTKADDNTFLHIPNLSTWKTLRLHHGLYFCMCVE